MCDHCDQRQSDSSFIFGLVVGAVIAAVVAVYIYKNNKSDVFVTLKKNLEKYFANITKPSEAPKQNNSSKAAFKSVKVEKKSNKVTVVIPENIETIDLKPLPKRKPVKMFKK